MKNSGSKSPNFCFYICREKNGKYFEVAEKRINGKVLKPNSFEKTEERGLFLF